MLLPVLLAVAMCVGAALFAVAWIRLGMEWQDVWSISIYSGASPLMLRPHPLIGDEPVISASDITDTKARFVADPFLLRRDAQWHLFFEVFEEQSGRGVIAVAHSPDGLDWKYDRIVLREPYHLSYPQVFEDAGTVYMVPESAEARAVCLYRAVDFPYFWSLEARLLEGTFFDASLVKHAGRWWMFAMDETESLRLFGSDDLRGGWTEHPRSPVIARSRRAGRPGGRVLLHEGALLRFSQDGEPTYGSRVRGFKILRLTATEYEEVEFADGPVLQGSGTGWNATGMHHLDACSVERGQWLASVDGNRRRKVWNWRLGARQMQRRMLRKVTSQARPSDRLQESGK